VEELQVIVRLSDDGKAYATSPQAPGLAFGRSSLDLLLKELDDVLSFHFDHPGPFNVALHFERHFDVADGELVIRIAQDANMRDRDAVARRIMEVITIPEQARSLVSAPNTVGESVYVCAVPSDTLYWLSVQLQPGERVNAALTIADNFLYTLPVATQADGMPIWAEGAASPETELSEVMQRNRVVTPQHVESLEVC
jgi:hypothetical protein